MTIILKLENESPSYIKLVGCKNESGWKNKLTSENESLQPIKLIRENESSQLIKLISENESLCLK